MSSLSLVLSSTPHPPFQQLRSSFSKKPSQIPKGTIFIRSPRKSTTWSIGRRSRKRAASPILQARLFGPAIFESSKLRVLILTSKKDEVSNPITDLHEGPRVYTLTHSDMTAKITLTVAEEINGAQLGGWYGRLQRDEVVAEWRKTKGVMSLHVHCHISSGGNILHILIAKLRFHIFQKELPVVLQAFMVGDRPLFRRHPELNYAPVWVYFHSSGALKYNCVEFWGPLNEAAILGPFNKAAIWEPPKEAAVDQCAKQEDGDRCQELLTPTVCPTPCHCCSRHETVVPVTASLKSLFFTKEQEKLRDYW